MMADRRSPAASLRKAEPMPSDTPGMPEESPIHDELADALESLRIATAARQAAVPDSREYEDALTMEERLNGLVLGLVRERNRTPISSAQRQDEAPKTDMSAVGDDGQVFGG